MSPVLRPDADWGDLLRARIHGGWGCQVLRSQTPSLFYRPARVPREQESQCRPCSCCTKKYSIQEFSSSVVRAVCLHICKTYSTVWHVPQFVYSSLSVCVCVFCLCFSYPNAICLFPIHPFPRQVLAAAALWSLAMC